MRFPKQIVVDDEVVTFEQRKPGARTAEGYGFAGQYLRNKVSVAAGLTLYSERETVFAELLHFAWEKSGLRNTYGMKTEEFIVHEFSGWFLQVLGQNPELRAYLFDD